MAWTEDDLTKVERAIASGNLSIAIGDRKVQKYGLKDLLTIRNLILGALGTTSGVSSIGIQYVSHDKGLL